MIALVQLIEIDQVRAVDIQQGAEGQAVVPARAEIPHLDLIIARRLPLTPQQQALARTQALIVDVADGEAQDQGPDQAEDDLAIAVDDVLGADVGQLDLAALDEVEGDVDVLEALDAEFGAGGVAAEGFLGEDLEEVDEDDAVGEVGDDVVDLDVTDGEFVVEPAPMVRAWLAIALQSHPLDGSGLSCTHHFVNVFACTFTHA